MGKIVLLDELTINQISAGEVIERPASVVKELVENSIDAGANKIIVEIENGGISKIRVIDNGSGIKKDDLEISFERHATSKIRQADDLQTVKSMGFRGEALASVAAIANVEMITKTEEDNVGNKIVVEGGKILEQEEVGAGAGTTITIKNLFFNTPVRYKFLKKDFTELGYIEDVITRIAIANPNIAIKLINSNKTIIQTNGDGDIKNVIYTIYGKDISQGLLNVKYEYEDIIVEGVVGKPEIARNNRAYQMFFVNKRYIKDKTLSAATEQAFKSLIPIGKYGVLMLNIQIDPKKVDVNVHPTKLEIRWTEEQKIFKAVYHSIREGLLSGDLIKNVDNSKEKNLTEEKQVETVEKTTDENVDDNKDNIENINKIPNFLNLFKKKEVVEEPFIENSIENTILDLYNKKNNSGEVENNTETNEQDEVISKKFKIPTEEQVGKMTDILNMQKTMNLEEQVNSNKVRDFEEMYEKTFGKLPEKKIDEEIKEDIKIESKDLISSGNVSIFKDNEVYLQTPNYKYIGALFNTYIVIEMKDEIYIIDQHAAHERIMYEKVKKNFYDSNEKDSQIMLLPDIITLSHKEKNIVKENTELFQKAGFIFEEFGDNTIRLIGVPSVCMELDTKQLFLDILDEIDTVAITATQEKEDKFISTIACKAAVKANMKLDKDEVSILMQKLFKLPNPFTCPHGRPTAIKMSKIDIEKNFNRR